jgi:hypothetical protein
MVLLVNFFVLAASTQGRQIIILLAEDGRWIWIWFGIASIWLATNAWYWPRFILSGPLPPIEDGNDQRRERREHARVGTVRRVPRVIGAATFVLLAFAFLIVSRDVAEWARWRLYFAAGLLIAAAVAFYAAVIARRRFLRAVESYLAGQVPVGVLVPLMGQIVQSMQPIANLTSLRPITKIFVWLNYIVAVILFLGAYLMPVRLAWFLSTEAVLLIASASWIAFLTLIARFGRWAGFPALTALLALALLFSLWNDNHELRNCTDPCGQSESSPSPMVKAAEAFREWHVAETASVGAKGPPTIVVVATAGGGIRAAYWTATVLGGLQDAISGLDNHLFAISGVSGGSVGAAIYRTLLNAKPGPVCNRPESPARNHGFAECGQAVLEADFLGPTLVSALYPDLVQRFLPFGLLPDRAEGIEKSFEAGWRTAFPNDQVGLERAFDSLWPDPTRKWPALILNSTVVETGRRAVASNLDLRVPGAPSELAINIAAVKRMRISTAANSSARFPYVEPAGSVQLPDLGSWSRVVDGGYSENFGAAGLLELLKAIHGVGLPVRIVVIQIASDPEMPMILDESERSLGCRYSIQPKSPTSMFASEILSPIDTFLNAREERGYYAAELLRDWAKAADLNSYFVFQLSARPGAVDPPLGWTLSTDAQAFIDRQWRECEQAKVAVLRQLLNP